MPPFPNIGAIRACSPAEIARHLRESLETSPVEAITHDLLEAVESGAIPSTHFTIWLGVCRSPTALAQALRQNVSVGVRIIGIKRLRKALRASDWKATWTGLGGVQGLLALFSDFSVREVRAACSAIGRCAGGHDVEEKRQRITELIEALLPRLSPASPVKTSDGRPLSAHYEQLAPGCNPDFVARLLDERLNGDWKHVKQRYLLQSHPDALRKLALRSISDEEVKEPGRLPDLFEQYPAATTRQPGLSSSMEFALEYLRVLVKGDHSTTLNANFVYDLAEPLLRRSLRKRLDWSLVLEIVDLIVRYIDEHPDVRENLSTMPGGLTHFVALCWSRRPQMFEKPFAAMLRHACADRNGEIGLDYFDFMYRGIARSRQYDLLRFCFMAVAEKDIGRVDHLKGMKESLAEMTLRAMEPEAALDLLNRLREARGDDDSIDTGNPDLLAVGLLLRLGKTREAEDLAREGIRRGQKKATSTSDQTQRASHAHSVLCFALASESLGIYKDALIWAKRFVRDPHTAPQLWYYYSSEAKALLSGIPRDITADTGADILRGRVEEANQVLRVLFETTCLALREPSFYLVYWGNNFVLIRQAVEQRIERSRELVSICGFNDDQVYDIVWADTVKFLIEVEREGLKPGHAGLEMNTLDGVLNFRAGGRKYELKGDEPPSTFRFFDELAKARDELWRSLRPTVHSAAATLPAPYPRGLPVQKLTSPWLLNAAQVEALAPYVASRAKEIVYIDPTLARTPFPDDEETKAAIGHFVDDYYYALQLLIPKSLGDDEKRTRVDQALAHAYGSLSESRMSSDEAIRYWGRNSPRNTTSGGHDSADDEYTRFWPHHNPIGRYIREWPIVPSVEDASDVNEWNPVPTPVNEIQPRPLGTLTYIDLATTMSTKKEVGISTMKSTLKAQTPEIPGNLFEEDAIWSIERTARAKGNAKVREGQVVSALLFLDTLHSSRNRILSSPFPSQGVTRYPTVYLDEYFLTKYDPSAQEALKALGEHIGSVPPTLLAQLTENIVNALDDSKMEGGDVIELEQTAFRLVSLLAKSDRPGLAAQLAVKTIIRRPDASSWHRQLLSPGYFRRLPASDARACFQAFVSAILAKLEEQVEARKARDEERAKVGERSGGDSEKGDEAATETAPAKPLVKVTTVKFLAQLLRDTEFVSEAFAVDVLSTLSVKASHVDIKQSVVLSLLNMLRTAPSDLSERILTSLETMIPIISNLNVRHPITDADWTKASESLELPETDHDWRGESLQMLKSITGFLDQVPDGSPHIAAYTQRILLPTLSGLQEETRKWTSIFLRKHGVDEQAQAELNLSIPPGSFEPWKDCIRIKPAHLPATVLEEYVEYLRFNIKPPAPIAALNKRLTGDPAVRSKPDVGFWLGLYNQGLDVVSAGRFCSLPRAFYVETKLGEKGITTQRAQQLFLELVAVTVMTDDARFGRLAYLRDQLRPRRLDKAWLEKEKPVVEAMVRFVEGRRSHEWQRDAGRKPTVLPDMYAARLWLLTYPSQEGLEGEREAKCRRFAEQIAREVEGMAGKVYHTKLAQLKEAFDFLDEVDGLHVALHLGDITSTRLSWITLQDHLRVELASVLVEKGLGRGGGMAVEGGEGLKQRVEGLLESWQKGESEEVRRLGYTMHEKVV